MAFLKWSNKKIASLLIFVLILHTVSGFPTSGTTSAVLRPSRSTKHKRSSVDKVAGEYLDDGNKKRFDPTVQIISVIGEGTAHVESKSGVPSSLETEGLRDGRACGNTNFVFQAVKQIIVEQLDVDAGHVKLTSTFVDDLGADSLGMVELILALEEHFGIDIPDEDAGFHTVRDAVSFIKRHIKC